MGLFSKLFNNKIETIVPVPETPVNNNVSTSGNFHMTVEDVFTIMGRGTVVTGRVDLGDIRVGEIVSINGVRSTEVLGIEMFRKTLDYAQAGDNCGILLKDISRDDIHKGDNLTK